MTTGGAGRRGGLTPSCRRPSAAIEGEGVSEGEEIPPAALLDGAAAVRLYMRWGSGARLEVAAAHARLELTGGERFETFVDGATDTDD